jgi:mRNA-degrading endonuclease RelE of RelBE toxin-antitoxin system
LQIRLSKHAQKFLLQMTQKKHQLQIKYKIEALRLEPFPIDSTALQGDLKGKYRADVGEYRIIYAVDNDEKSLKVSLIGKRNDGEIYKKASRK